MSCGSDSCGCRSANESGGGPESASPVTDYIAKAKKQEIPEKKGFLARSLSWFVNTVIADMRITRVRVLSQTFFFLLFLFFVVITDLRYLKGYPVSLFLELDPLVAVATAMTTGTVYKTLIISLVLLLPTLLLGRFFCNWICPYGTLHQFTRFLFGKRDEQWQIDSNRFRSLQQLKYIILVAMLVAAAFGSLQIGLLDPICLFHRSMSTAILPGINLVLPDTFYVKQFFHVGAWLIGAILFFFVGMNVVIPRFFCRAVCPLGAFLGVLSRFCLKNCQGASDPHTQLRKSECFVCFECIEDCPVDAISFSFMPNKDHEVANPPMPGRRTAMASLFGIAGYAVARASGSSDSNFKKEVIRPPGSVKEDGFLERCIKCDQCIRVCPTNVLQPTIMEAGLEGFWTPILNMKTGYCELNCTLCGQVCPTGAIQRVTIEEKNGRGDFAEQGPIKLGTAFYDRGRCLPWAMETPCVVCEEVCPTSPKAIYSREVTIRKRDGNKITLRRPYVDPSLCIGCGICEHECPVKDHAAIRVTAIGETRSQERRLLMDGGDPSNLLDLVKRNR
jgi:ferredoxin